MRNTARNGDSCSAGVATGTSVERLVLVTPKRYTETIKYVDL